MDREAGLLREVQRAAPFDAFPSHGTPPLAPCRSRLFDQRSLIASAARVGKTPPRMAPTPPDFHDPLDSWLARIFEPPPEWLTNGELDPSSLPSPLAEEFEEFLGLYNSFLERLPPRRLPPRPRSSAADRWEIFDLILKPFDYPRLSRIPRGLSEEHEKLFREIRKSRGSLIFLAGWRLNALANDEEKIAREIYELKLRQFQCVQLMLDLGARWEEVRRMAGLSSIQTAQQRWSKKPSGDP